MYKSCLFNKFIILERLKKELCLNIESAYSCLNGTLADKLNLEERKMKFSLSLDLEEFEKRKQKAIDKYNEGTDEESKNTTASFNELDFELGGFEFENGELTLYGNTPIGWIDLTVNMGLDLAIEVIEFYMKKLGKLKTILEASK